MARVFITEWSVDIRLAHILFDWSDQYWESWSWSNLLGCEQRAASRCEIHISTIQLTYIEYSTPHLRATLLCIFNGFVGYVWRTHPIIHIPAFINFTAEGPKNRVRESEIYSMKVIQIKGTSYAPSFPLASFPLLSYILSVSRERISKGQCAATVGTAVIDSDSMATAS